MSVSFIAFGIQSYVLHDFIKVSSKSKKKKKKKKKHGTEGSWNETFMCVRELTVVIDT
jgi:hypothetical protein